jgi:hypothetical protein
MSYRVLSTGLKTVTSEAFTASASESKLFTALCEALSWAARPRGGNFAVVVVEEPQDRPLSLSLRSMEEAARSVV